MAWVGLAMMDCCLAALRCDDRLALAGWRAGVSPPEVLVWLGVVGADLCPRALRACIFLRSRADEALGRWQAGAVGGLSLRERAEGDASEAVGGPLDATGSMPRWST